MGVFKFLAGTCILSLVLWSAYSNLIEDWTYTIDQHEQEHQEIPLSNQED